MTNPGPLKWFENYWDRRPVRQGDLREFREEIEELGLGGEVSAQAGGASAMLGTSGDELPRLSLHPTATVTLGGNFTSGSSLYWPSTVNVEGLISSPLDKWYKLVSTDHDSGGGGIYLLTAPAPEGPWTDRGLIYRDTTAGNQTETPSLLYVPEDPDGKPWYCYYQQNSVPSSGRQSTLLAKSATMLSGSWTRVGIVFNPPPSTETTGSPHTGYQRPWRVGNMFFSRGLLVSGDYSAQAMWTSSDGVTWVMDPRPIGRQADTSPDPATIKTGIGSPFMWRGRLWAATSVLPYAASGAFSSAMPTSAALVPLSPDGRVVTGPALVYDLPLPASADVGVGAGSPFVGPDGSVYIEIKRSSVLYLAKVGDTGTPPRVRPATRIALPRDPLGRPARVGLVRKEKTWDFWEQTLPADLAITSSNSTATHTLSTSPAPRLAVTTTGTPSGSDARVTLAYDLDVTDYSAVWITAEGFNLSHTSDQSFFMLLSGTQTGVRLWQDRTASFASVVQTLASSINTEVYYKLLGTDVATKRKSFTLLWHIKRKIAYVLEGDQVQAAVAVPSAVPGLIRPSLVTSMHGTHGVARTLAVERLSIGYER